VHGPLPAGLKSFLSTNIDPKTVKLAKMPVAPDQPYIAIGAENTIDWCNNHTIRRPYNTIATNQLRLRKPEQTANIHS